MLFVDSVCDTGLPCLSAATWADIQEENLFQALCEGEAGCAGSDDDDVEVWDRDCHFAGGILI